MHGADLLPRSEAKASPRHRDEMLWLGIDTCGPSGSVALSRLPAKDADAEILVEIELERRSYSATLVAAIGDLLDGAQVRLEDVQCLIAVNGPGSFTGVRVGLSTVKGLAEAAGIPIVAVSRLEVLAAKAGTQSSALDAHRSELFLRICEPGGPTELLAGPAELAIWPSPPDVIAICDDAAKAMLGAAWPAARLVRTAAPSAADAIRLAAPRVLAAAFADVMLLDGNYLRRSDAEIFGEPAPGTHPK